MFLKRGVLVTAPAMYADTAVSELYYFPQPYLLGALRQAPEDMAHFQHAPTACHLCEIQDDGYLDCLGWRGYVISKLCIQTPERFLGDCLRP